MPTHHPAWNKGRLLGQKPPLKPKEIWSLRIRLQLAGRQRDLAMFNLAIDSKLRGCDLVSLRVRDVYQGTVVASRAIVMQRKTQQPVQLEITEATRESVSVWVAIRDLRSNNFLCAGREEGSHLSVRQDSRIVKGWAACIKLEQGSYGTHALRRTKATFIIKRTKNIRAIQLLLGHTKLECTVRYLGIEVDDALELSEQTEI